MHLAGAGRRDRDFFDAEALFEDEFLPLEDVALDMDFDMPDWEALGWDWEGEEDDGDFDFDVDANSAFGFDLDLDLDMPEGVRALSMCTGLWSASLSVSICANNDNTLP